MNLREGTDRRARKERREGGGTLELYFKENENIQHTYVINEHFHGPG